MNIVLRSMTALAAALALSGCDQVGSNAPWFTEVDAAGAAPLRLGVWSLSFDPNCVAPARWRLERWPKCAQVVIVRARDVASYDSETKTWTDAPFILAATDPRVIQLGRDPALTDRPAYGYEVVVVTSTDAGGRIIRFKQFFMLCDGETMVVAKTAEPAARPNGSSEPVAAEPSKPRRPPLPGLIMNDSSNGCTAQSRSALIAAARANAAGQIFMTARWVRDGER